jgi:hypothetical protein
LEAAFWSQILDALKHYGPIVTLFLVYVAWQARKIDQLIDKNSSIYDGEIKRLADVQQQLLTKLLGTQPTSTNSPTIQEVRDKSSQADGDKEGKK